MSELMITLNTVLAFLSMGSGIIGISMIIRRVALERKVDGLREKLGLGPKYRIATQRKKVGLNRLVRFADFLGLNSRKAIKAMAGDFDVEIRRLRQDQRLFAANWNICLAWGYALWFILRSPADLLLKYLIKSFSGFGT